MPGRRKTKNLTSRKRRPVKVTKRKPLQAKVQGKKKNKTKTKVSLKPELKAGEQPVRDLSGKKLDTLKISNELSNHEPNTDILYQAIIMYQAGEREGTAKTKERGSVRGGGKKPWRQKGTGRARHGSRRSPIWRGGGVTFGPMPRDFSYSLPLELRHRAVTEAVKYKVANGKLILVDHLNFPEAKTKQIVDFMNTFKLKKPLFLVSEKNENLERASRNISKVSVKTAGEVNVLDLARSDECVMTKSAYAGLVKRLEIK